MRTVCLLSFALAVFSFIEIVWSRLLVLNRAKGPARLMRGGQYYKFWGCGEGAGFYKKIEIWGAG
jgi:hypothetical protein